MYQSPIGMWDLEFYWIGGIMGLLCMWYGHWWSTKVTEFQPQRLARFVGPLVVYCFGLGLLARLVVALLR